jgi:hypothetical protein
MTQILLIPVFPFAVSAIQSLFRQFSAIVFNRQSRLQSRIDRPPFHRDHQPQLTPSERNTDVIRHDTT